MKRKDEHNIVDVFNDFCKERHAEDKGKNYNLLQEVYANTELFDVSHYLESFEDENIYFVNQNLIERDTVCFEDGKLDTVKESIGETSVGSIYALYTLESLKNISLPFNNCFVKYIGINEIQNVYLFVRELTPTVLSGTTYFIFKNGNKINLPFQLISDLGTVRVLIKDIWLAKGLYETDEYLEDQLMLNLGEVIADVLLTLNNLSKKTVAVDIPIRKVEYYPRKKADTIKVVNRPIYYVLDKKEKVHSKSLTSITPRGKLEITHSFKVRGHWRHLLEKQIGKDRNGEYKVKGYTWVKEHVRGEGELVKRIREIK